MASLGALTQAWTSAEAALPLDWRVTGLYRFEDLWVGLAEGPEFDDYASGIKIDETYTAVSDGDALAERRRGELRRTCVGSVGTQPLV